MKLKKADLVVIGSGPGGYAAAFRAADLDREVLLIEKDSVLGGVCLNRGCIPSKAFLHISKVIGEAEYLSTIGVKFKKPEINVKELRDYKNKVVSRLNGGIAQMAKARSVEVIEGVASFASNAELVVKSKKEKIKVSFKDCIIASGSSSSLIPGLPKNSPLVLTSKTALELETVPKKLLVVGGGIIGLELGQVYASLGSQVTVVEFLSTLVPGADSDIIKPLQRRLNKQFRAIMLSSKVIDVKEVKKKQIKC